MKSEIMTDKKISRRGFIKGLAVCVVAVPLVPGLMQNYLLTENVSSVDRATEAQAFLDAMNEEMANVLFYGDVREGSEVFSGLRPRTMRKGLPPMAWRHLETGKVRYA